VRGRRKGFCKVPRRARGALSRARAVTRAPRAGAIGVALASALLATACGGGTRQDAGEPAGTFPMKVVNASFPAIQSIARKTSFVLQVRNTGVNTVPNVAVTVDSFDYTSNYPNLAANKRPVWVVERGPGAIPRQPVESEEISPPGGGQTAYVNTWALGSLPPNRTRTFVWRVVPVKSGAYAVHYTVAADLAGKAKAELPSGGPVTGKFAVYIRPAPALTHVNPDTGRVERGQFPLNP